MLNQSVEKEKYREHALSANGGGCKPRSGGHVKNTLELPVEPRAAGSRSSRRSRVKRTRFVGSERPLAG